MGVFSRFLNCTNGTKLQSATLLKVTLLHGCFSRFLNCTIGAKSCKTLCKVIWTLENQRFPSSAGHCSNIVNGRQTWSKDIDIDKWEERFLVPSFPKFKDKIFSIINIILQTYLENLAFSALENMSLGTTTNYQLRIRSK